MDNYKMRESLLSLLCMVFVTGQMACTENDSWSFEQGSIPIVLTQGNDEETTRASYVQDMQFVSGQKLNVWAKHTNTSNDYFKTWVLIANGSGGFTGTTKYYPASGTNIDLYALHGNFSYTEGDISLPTTAISHTVLANQTGSGFATSDLMATREVNKGPQGNANQGNSYKVPMNGFKHLLSRVEVEIISLDYLDAPDIKSIELLGVKTTNTVIMPTYADANPTVGSTSATPTSNITMRFGNTNAKAECIIPAQNIASGEAFIRLTLVDDNTLTYTTSQAFNFENGKSYRFEMQIVASKIQAYAVSVKSWDELNNGIEYYVLQTIDNTSTGINATESSSQNLYWEYGGGENGSANLKGEEWFP